MLRALRKKSFRLDLFLGGLRRQLEDRKNGRPTPILVYQMGRVASSSVRKALSSVYPGVYHIHTLSPLHLRRELEVFRLHHKDRGSISAYVLDGLFLNRRMREQDAFIKPWILVSLLRDPIARNVSTFFKNLDLHHADLDLAARLQAGKSASIGQLTDSFVSSFLHESALDWFDREPRTFFGLDVYSQNFDRTKRTLVLENERARLLVLRTEDLQSHGTSALEEFFCHTFTDLPEANRGFEKWYAQAYRRFLIEARLPDDLVARMYDSRMVRHFYSQEEIGVFRQRWTGRA